jgi:hypothetical protein
VLAPRVEVTSNIGRAGRVFFDDQVGAGFGYDSFVLRQFMPFGNHEAQRVGADSVILIVPDLEKAQALRVSALAEDLEDRDGYGREVLDALVRLAEPVFIADYPFLSQHHSFVAPPKSSAKLAVALIHAA